MVSGSRANLPSPHLDHGGRNIIMLECLEIIEFFALMTRLHTAPDAIPQGQDNPLRPAIAIITNVGSTHNKALSNWIDPHVAGAPDVTQIYASGPADINAALAQAAAIKSNVIVVNGGDGTADLVFGALLNHKPFTTMPAVALLSAGKTNMTAAAWSFGGDKVQAIRRIISAQRDGTLLRHVTHRPILAIDTGEGRPLLRGAFLGAADVVNGILFCREHIYPMKLPNALSHGLALGLLVWRGLFAGADAKPMEINWNDTASENHKLFFVSATTLDKLIVGLLPQPDRGEGPIHYLSVHTGARALCAVMPKLMTKKLTSGWGHSVRRAERITLSFDGAYTLDGELYQATRAQPLTVSANDTLPFIQIASP
jgi:hypothetical protein